MKKEKFIHPITNKKKSSRKISIEKKVEPVLETINFSIDFCSRGQKTLQIGFSFPSRLSTTASSTGLDPCKVRATVRIAIMRHQQHRRETWKFPVSEGKNQKNERRKEGKRTKKKRRDEVERVREAFTDISEANEDPFLLIVAPSSSFFISLFLVSGNTMAKREAAECS